MSREQECKRILGWYSPENFAGISEALDRQFRTIHNRAQLLLGICGVLISASVLVTTGRLIGRVLEIKQQHLVSILLATAGVMEITGAALIVGGVLDVRWITQQPGDDLHDWVMSNLAFRDRKTRFYRLAILLVLLSMISYQIAFVVAVFGL
jgi:hypothetical protein